MPRITDYRSEQDIFKENIFFLKIPGDETRPGGVGITVKGDKSHLVGALNVDTSGGHLRPFLKYCIKKTGKTPYPLMEHDGDSYFYCQMFIDDDSLTYVEETRVGKSASNPFPKDSRQHKYLLSSSG